jgi:hypothetical protein
MRSAIRNKVISILREEYTPPKPNFIRKLRGLILSVSSNSAFDNIKDIDKLNDTLQGSSFGNLYLNISMVRHIEGFKEKCSCIYKEGDDFYEKEGKNGKDNPKEYTGDLLDFENSESIELSSSKFTIYAGGDWQPMHCIVIKMKENGSLYIDECKRADDLKMGKGMKEKDVIEKLLSAPWK